MVVYYLLMGFIFLFVVAIELLMPELVSQTLPFGVRVPSAHAKDPAIGAIRRTYRRQILGGALIIALATVVLTILTDQHMILAGSLVLLLIVFWAIYYRAHRQLRAIKEERGWYEGQKQAVMVDPTLRTQPTPLPWGWAIPAVLILLITVAVGVWVYPSLPETLTIHWNAQGEPDGFADKSIVSAFGVVGVQAGMTLLMLGLVWFIPRFRQEIDVENPRRSVAQYRGYHREVSKGMLFLAACTNLSMFFTALQVWELTSFGVTVAMLATTIPIIVGLVGMFWFILRTGQAGARLRPAGAEADDASSSGYVNRDDDRYWKAGQFYVNPDDPALWVNKRFGIGWTINLGHPLGWLVLILLLVVPTALTLLLTILAGRS